MSFPKDKLKEIHAKTYIKCLATKDTEDILKAVREK